MPTAVSSGRVSTTACNLMSAEQNAASRGLGRLLSKVAPIEPREVPAVVIAFCLFFCVFAGYFSVRPVRETVGTVLGRDDLKHEGQAQQDKAEAQRDVAKKEAEADASRAAASAAETREESHRRA